MTTPTSIYKIKVNLDFDLSLLHDEEKAFIVSFLTGWRYMDTAIYSYDHNSFSSLGQEFFNEMSGTRKSEMFCDVTVGGVQPLVVKNTCIELTMFDNAKTQRKLNKISNFWKNIEIPSISESKKIYKLESVKIQKLEFKVHVTEEKSIWDS